MNDFFYPLRSRIRQTIGKYPAIFYSTYGMKSLNNNLGVVRDTELVIEGFPRSANTYSVVAFEHLQSNPVKIAHHLHVPCQIIRAVEYQIPIILLIRNPHDATISFIIRNPNLTIEQVLRQYIDFYDFLLKYKNYCYIARFEDVINQYETVINQVNSKFNTKFITRNISEQDKQIIYDRIKKLNLKFEQGKEERSAFPSDKKKNLKEELKILVNQEKYQSLLTKANKIYQEYLET